MDGDALGIGVPGPARALPPLRKPGEIGVMARHRGIDPFDPPPLLAHPVTHLGLLARDQVFAVAAHVVQRRHAHQRIAATGLRGADRRIGPFLMDQPVIDRGLGELLLLMAEDHGQSLIGVESGATGSDPAMIDLAIAIDELHEFRVRKDPLGHAEARHTRPGCMLYRYFKVLMKRRKPYKDQQSLFALRAQGLAEIFWEALIDGDKTPF